MDFASVAHRMVHRTKCDEIAVFEPEFFTCINWHSMVNLQASIVIPSPGVVQISYTYLAQVIIALLDLSAFFLPCRRTPKSRGLIYFLVTSARLFTAYIVLLVDPPAILA